jgi:hypothetical protein
VPKLAPRLAEIRREAAHGIAVAVASPGFQIETAVILERHREFVAASRIPARKFAATRQDERYAITHLSLLDRCAIAAGKRASGIDPDQYRRGTRNPKVKRRRRARSRRQIE